MQTPPFAVPFVALPAAVLTGVMLAGVVPGMAEPVHASTASSMHSATGSSSQYHLLGDGRLQGTPDAALTATDPAWYVGSLDGYGATQPFSRPALEPAGGGAAAYRAGLTGADRVVMSGLHPESYDLAGIVGDDTDRLYPVEQSTASEPDGDTRTGFITGYTIHDNDPAGSKEIAYSKRWDSRAVHTEAGGTGTYADPITLAAQAGDYTPGTLFYLPHVKRYFVLEDTCAACGQKSEWIDMWIGGELSDSAAATTECAEALTGTHEFIVNPGAGLPVATGPLFNSATDTCYVPTRASTTPVPDPSGNTVVGDYGLKGAIGKRWAGLGGSGWATPVSAEHPSGYGSVHQRFVGTDGKEKAIYWSPATGTRVVNYGGSIGRKFAAAGYAGTYGPPSTDERTVPGGAYQVFNADGKTTKILWSPSTYSKAVKEYGAIGRRWAALGYERGLGFPSTDEYRTASGWAQEFTGGRIEYNTTTRVTSVIRG